MGIQSLPLSKSKRKFRLRRITMHRALSAALWAVLLFLSLTGSRLALAQGGLQRVNHIIIVMQEKHSFDYYFGALAYAPGSPYHNANGACLPSDHKCVDGLSCIVDVSGNLTWWNSILEDDGSTVVAFHDPSRCVIPDLDHSWFGTHKQVNFLNPNSTLTNFLSDGFVRVNDVAGQLDNGTETSTEDQTMGVLQPERHSFLLRLGAKIRHRRSLLRLCARSYVSEPLLSYGCNFIWARDQRRHVSPAGRIQADQRHCFWPAHPKRSFLGRLFPGCTARGQLPSVHRSGRRSALLADICFSWSGGGEPAIRPLTAGLIRRSEFRLLRNTVGK